jgi:hypothetical protein
MEKTRQRTRKGKSRTEERKKKNRKEGEKLKNRGGRETKKRENNQRELTFNLHSVSFSFDKYNISPTEKPYVIPLIIFLLSISIFFCKFGI